MVRWRYHKKDRPVKELPIPSFSFIILNNSMQKHFLVGTGLAFVVLAGAGCGKTAPVATLASPGSEKTPVTESVNEVKATPESVVKSKDAPVEVSMLGLTENKRGLRARVKNISPYNFIDVFMAYTCVDDAGQNTDKAIDRFQNPAEDGTPQLIKAGQVYETELYLTSEPARCTELKPSSVVFEDRAEWSPTYE